MKIGIYTICVLFFSGIALANEKLHVKVVDDEGNPVSNAVVCVGFTESHLLFGGGLRGNSVSHHYKATTDTNGNAVVKFNCTSSDFEWHVDADGYYGSGAHAGHFDGEDVLVPPCFVKVVLHEHEKHVGVTLWKKRNPQPMIAHYPIERRKVPTAIGRYGFDLAEYDWLEPHGKGKNADFYLVRNQDEIPPAGEYEFGHIEFERDCGFYIANKTGCSTFQTTYKVDGNMSLQTNITLKCIRHIDGKDWIEPLPIMENDKYMVVRSRVKHDDNGRIVSANYSRILGRFTVVPSVSSEETVFNPRPNDTNLEFDLERNLYQGKRGRGKVQ